ncbi:hypothetical protein BKI52_45105 [marine bacterium AO1-C]|nr:hypothetical protein BKI52_45105 [marine bacterium AO1-C]
MKTQLEIQADELWQTQELAAEVRPDDKFWKRYNKLVNASRKITFKPPVYRPSQVLDTVVAYKQLPHRYYDDLFKRDKAFSRRSLLGSAALSLNALNILPFGVWGFLAALGGCFVLRFAYLSAFKTGYSFSLDIQPYHLLMGNKHRKRKVLLTHITGFSVDTETIKLTAEIPKKNGRIRKKEYHIPLTKSKNERLPDNEITAICQFLEAIINENEKKNK